MWHQAQYRKDWKTKEGGGSMTNEELMEQYQANPEDNEDILALLYEQNLDLIWDIANKGAKAFNCFDSTAYSYGVREELVCEGTVAFLEAIKSGKYNMAQGKLTTYVYPFIKGAIYRWLEKNVDAVSVSKRNMEIIHQVQKMYYEYGYSSTEIAQKINIPEVDVSKHLEYNKRHLSTQDLQEENRLTAAENCMNVGNILAQKSAQESVEYAVMTKIWLEKLPEIFEQLRKRDRFVLGHFYGIYGYEKMKLAELALRLELTIDGVYKSRDSAINRAKKIYYASDLFLWHRAYVDTKITAQKGR